jgi:hypothetical protein
VNASSEQIATLRKVAFGLGDLRDRVVFLGGAALGLLITDPGADEARPTMDVDLIVEVASQGEYYEKLCKRLRGRGFREDSREGAPLCRWLLDEQAVDVMPTNPQILGFSNAWYPHALATAQRVTLTAGTAAPVVIHLISAPAFLATKLASFASRGAGDLLHRDIEDIIALVDGRVELIGEVESDNRELGVFVAQSIRALLGGDLEEHIASHLPGDPASQAREPFVVTRLRRLARLTEFGT